MDIERKDSQRSQNNGPRVSFNRDVHVKRIGSRPNTDQNYSTNLKTLSQHSQQQQQPQQLIRQLPQTLSEAGLLKEAALVLAQAERIKCTAEGGNDTVRGRGGNEKIHHGKNERKKVNDNPATKFNSLPSRKKAVAKPVSRSVSDASAKKTKKPSIFNIFSRKSDSNLDQIDSGKIKDQITSGKRVERSKSDVGSGATKEKRLHQPSTTIRTRHISESEDGPNLTKKAQLSPIIENTPQEEFFKSPKSTGQRQIKNLEHITTPQTKLNSGQTNDEKRNKGIIKDKKNGLSTNINQQKETTKLRNLTKPPSPPPPPPLPFSSSATGTANSQNLLNKSGNIGYTNQSDLDLIPSKPIIENFKTKQSFTKSTEDMHSSQKPAEKPPLTKGLTVDGMVKRLSMERFSPPPHLNGPAFSYTRPNEQQIIYAQVVCDPADPKQQKIKTNSNNFGIDDDTMIRGYNSSRTPINGYHHNDQDRYNGNTTSHNKTGDNYQFDNDEPKPPARKRNGHNIQPVRNYSDEDEGVGLETRRPYEEDTLNSRSYSTQYRNEYKNQSIEEPPIVPIIREMTPVHIPLSHRGKADGMDTRRYDEFRNTHFPEFNDLSERRRNLETRFQTKRLGSREMLNEYSPERDIIPNDYQPEQNKKIRQKSREYRSPSPVGYLRNSSLEPHQPSGYDEGPKFHKVDTNDLLNKYSPERSHLDIIAPRKEKTMTSSKYETKYYQNGNGGGYKETFKSETKLDADGKPYTVESRARERLKSPRLNEINLGYIEDHRYASQPNMEFDSSYFQDKYRQPSRDNDYEPYSFDSYPSGERYDKEYHSQRLNYPMQQQQQQHHQHRDEIDTNGKWQNTLSRGKKQQRSFEKCDSGIENDYRKDSFNGEMQSRWRRRTFDDDIKACELFLRKERKHSEESHPTKRMMNYAYRERSIDDGSHFDPRLDKYESSEGTLRRQQDRGTGSTKENRNGTIKSEKKLGGLEKVKQLFTTSKKKTQSSNSKPDSQRSGSHDKYMVREDEMRSRYREYRGNYNQQEPLVPDIANRRRLSTPKASPIPKRTSSQKSTKSISTLAQSNNSESTGSKLGWFKSLERLSRKNKNNVKHDTTTTEEELSSLKTKSNGSRVGQFQSKNLRFFGDTDLESNASISKKTTTMYRPRKPLYTQTLERSHRHSRSAYDLDAMTPKDHSTNGVVNANKIKSKSMQHLHMANARHLHDISESASDTEFHSGNQKQKHQLGGISSISGTKSKLRSRHSSTEPDPASRSISAYRSQSLLKDNSSYEEDIENELPFEEKRYMFETKGRGERNTVDGVRRTPLKESSVKNDNRKPPPGPQKPARAFERRRAFSRERDRIHDSSGTEGDSSQHSSRSVVYLHATTVGEIPQPYVLNARRRAASREELSSTKLKQKQEPMKRSVSRSVSMLAPWTPKHISEGYEINYSQQSTPHKYMKYNRDTKSMEKTRTQTLPRTLKKETKSSTLGRPTKKYYSKDDSSSPTRNSSVMSTSNSGYPTMPRTSSKDKSYSHESSGSYRRWNH